MTVSQLLQTVSPTTQIWIEKEDETHIENNEAAYISEESKRLRITRIYPAHIQSLGVKAIVVVADERSVELAKHITIVDEQQICKDAVETFGATAQMIMCMEEMAELTQALSKIIRGKEEFVDNVIEELVDVDIMLSQMYELFNTHGDKNGELFADTHYEKLIALQERIRQHKSEVTA